MESQQQYGRAWNGLIHVPEDMDMWQVVLSKVMSRRLSWNSGNCLNKWRNVGNQKGLWAVESVSHQQLNLESVEILDGWWTINP